MSKFFQGSDVKILEKELVGCGKHDKGGRPGGRGAGRGRQTGYMKHQGRLNKRGGGEHIG